MTNNILRYSICILQYIRESLHETRRQTSVSSCGGRFAARLGPPDDPAGVDSRHEHIAVCGLVNYAHAEHSVTGGSSRHKPVIAEAPPAPKASPKPKKKSVTSAITVHFPKQVRDQLKILAIQHGNTLHGVVAEAFNDFFAKHGKPEIAPKDSAAVAE